MIFESFLLNFTVAFGLILALTFDYVTKFFSYWYVRHVAYKTSVPFYGSDYHRILGLRSNTGEINALYKQFPKEDLVGSIKSRIPDLTVKDPDLIKKVLSTAFENFQSRGVDLCKSQDVCIRDNLFYADGGKWTVLREGFETLLNDTTCVDDCLFECLKGTNGDANVQEMLSKVLDAVFENMLFGDINGDSVKELRSGLQTRSLLDKYKNYLKTIFPSIYVVFGFVTLSGQPSKQVTDRISKSNLIKKVESSFQFEKDANKNLKSKPDAVALGVVTTFINEGYIPCLNLLTCLCYELSKNEKLQSKARESEEYLEAVIKETLRLYPTHSVITRKCVKSYKFPELNDNKVLIDRGITINVPVEALHRDNEHFKEAAVFNPDRFVNEIGHSYTYLPYGAGPRKCVGEQLSLQIIRLVARNVLQSFKISTTNKTPDSLKRVDHNFGRIVAQDLWLKFTPIQ